MVITFLTITTIYSIVASVFIYRLILKEEALEEFYEDRINSAEEKLIATKLKIEEVVEGLTQVDIRGSFEADDEVGFAFKEIKTLNDELLQFIIDLDKKINNA
jgi:hypothetical protein